MKTRVLIAAMLSIASAAQAGEFIPVTVAQFSTGQWFFDGKQSALGGNVSAQFVPAYKFSDKFAILPTVESNYRGTRSAEELAGGATLFQDTWENALGVKAVMSPTENWTYRARVSGRSKWYRETSDEKWTHGLYDYQSASGGGEAERKWGKVSLAAGYDFTHLHFPNYQSLESSQTGDQARELAGTDVLDSDIHMLSLRGHSPLPARFNIDVAGYIAPRMYSDQHVVVLSGLFADTKRVDTTSGVNVSLNRAFRGPLSSMMAVSFLYGYLGMQSNQNHYDARLTTFVPDFYDYDQQTTGVQLQAAFGHTYAGPMSADLATTYAHRNYRSRPIQDTDGSYLSEKLDTTETAVSAGFGYPLTRNIKARISTTIGRSRSNNKFEQLYRYNYSNANYQFGFVYEY